MSIGVYARVSSDSQDLRSQLPDLQEWADKQTEPVQWFTDHFSGKTMQRPGFDRLIQDVRARKIKTVVVWRLDRLGRLSSGLLTLLDELVALGCNFVSIREGIDIATISGRLVYGVLASVAQYEREVRQERQQAGIEACRKKNKGRCPWGGRKPGTVIKATPEKVATVRKLKADGTPIAVIARVTGLSRPTVYNILKETR